MECKQIKGWIRALLDTKTRGNIRRSKNTHEDTTKMGGETQQKSENICFVHKPTSATQRKKCLTFNFMVKAPRHAADRGASKVIKKKI